jgi:glutamyl-tRNA(Gln) amidotransferase subunit E
MRIGFEIHQQLDTHKLFCSCPSLLREDDPSYACLRRLRPTQSELGEVDEAAMKEFLKGKTYIYQGYSDTTCLVELDEEPPHTPNIEALKTALEIALLLKAEVVDEVHFMRKLVIDGSNTSGFQRTAVIAVDGVLELKEGRVRISTICLEEEAARKIADNDGETVFRLDRLGIPLVEISTAPDMTSPAMAREAALRIGEILRSTGKVKRGLGTIRQDINVSVEGGARVEIKGVQDLNQIPLIIKKEGKRQRMLLKVREELLRRGVSRKKLKFVPMDITEFLKTSESKLARRLLKKGIALALALPGFHGLLKKKLGPELAQHARVASGVKGIIHSDELPGYGLSDKDVREVRRALRIVEGDAFLLCLAPEDRARKALLAAYERALTALKGIPEETRVAAQDGTTSYMRPLPGAARMYPETDVPPVVITSETITWIRSHLPEPYEVKEERYVRDYELSREQAAQIVRSVYADLFEEVVEGTGVQASIAASTLLGTLKELRRENKILDVSASKDALKEVFQMIAKGEMAKEALPEVLAALAEDPGVDIREVLKEGGVEGASQEDVRKLIRRVVRDRESFVRERGRDAAKPLMGLLMKKLRGRCDGRLVNKLLLEELDRFIEEG